MITCDAMLCIDAGGTYFKGAVFDKNGTMPLPVYHEPVNQAGSVEEIVDTYVHIIRHFQASHTITAVAISTPGPFDYRRGISRMKHKFFALYGKPLADMICTAAGLDVPISFVSDTNAFLAGAAGGGNRCIGVTIGTGLGLAVLCDGKLLVNDAGGPAEVIYNQVIDGIMAEDVVSGRGISRAYEALTGEQLTAKAISERAVLGDQAACAVYRQMGDMLGRVLDPVIVRYRPERLILGGQISASLPLFREALCRRLTKPVAISSVAGLDTALKGVYYMMRDMGE